MTARYFLWAVFLPMCVGGVTYLLIRDTGMLMFHWVEAMGLMPPLMDARAQVAHLRPHLPDWLLFSMPDGAWVFSCTAFFARLWPDGPPWMRWSWILLGGVLAIGGELGQIVGLVPGTFDLMDLIAYLVAVLLALWASRRPGAASEAPTPPSRRASA